MKFEWKGAQTMEGSNQIGISGDNDMAKAYWQKTGLFSARMLVRVTLLATIVTSLTACCTARRITPEYDQAAATLNGRDVVVSYFKDFRRVRQDAPDLCWAAALEVALAHQGVDIDQKRIAQQVYPKADATADRTITMFQWRQDLRLMIERLHNGSEVVVRTDLDGGLEGPISTSASLTRRINWEIGHNRIPLVGISTGRGSGHIVAVIGAAFPLEDRELTPSRIVGFLIYDPLDGTGKLFSPKELYERFVGAVYVTTYNSVFAGGFGGSCSARNIF